MLKPARITTLLQQPLSRSAGLLRKQTPSSRRFTTFPARTPALRSPTRQIRWRQDPLRRFNSTQQKVEQKAQGLTARFKELSRKYGWAAVGVYFGLSILDFPFCFLAVRWIGTEKIAVAEEWVVERFWSVVKSLGLDVRPAQTEEAIPATGMEAGIQAYASEAEKKKHHDPSIWTQLILAYGVHKSLIFFRIPLTAAVTPKIVKWLRARGWKIGNPKAS